MINKKYKFLLVDVSNTNTKFAISKINNNNNSCSITKYLSKISTKKLSAKKINKIISKNNIKKIILCSVVPKKNKHFYNSEVKDIILINSSTKHGIKFDYPKPNKIGSDRIANTVYMTKVINKYPSVVIDFGTTVTFDIINKKGEFTGGVICPGIDSMFKYMNTQTALLPKINIKKPNKIIGKSTKKAMNSGAYFGYRGLIKQIIIDIKKELNQPKLFILATGSYAELILKDSKLVNSIKKNITLLGLNKILEQNINKYVT